MHVYVFNLLNLHGNSLNPNITSLKTFGKHRSPFTKFGFPLNLNLYFPQTLNPIWENTIFPILKVTFDTAIRCP